MQRKNNLSETLRRLQRERGMTQCEFAQALDPCLARERWLRTRAESGAAHDDDHCSMCGKAFCALRTTKRMRQGL